MRYHSAKDRWPIGKGIKTQVNLSIDEARLLYAAGQWLLKYRMWEAEAAKAKGRIGVYPAEFGLSVCVEFMNDLSNSLDKDNPRIILTERDIRILNSVAYHLDHYQMMLSFKDGKKNWKKR